MQSTKCAVIANSPLLLLQRFRDKCEQTPGRVVKIGRRAGSSKNIACVIGQTSHLTGACMSTFCLHFSLVSTPFLDSGAKRTHFRFRSASSRTTQWRNRPTDSHYVFLCVKLRNIICEISSLDLVSSSLPRRSIECARYRPGAILLEQSPTILVHVPFIILKPA